MRLTAQVQALLYDLQHLRVLVIGDAILDGYMRGNATRLCREAPAPVVAVAGCSYVPGGAANAAANIRSLGAQPLFVSCIGQDEEGHLLRLQLERAGIEPELLVCASSRRTLAKRRVVADGQVLLRLDQGSTDSLQAAEEQEVLDRVAKAFTTCDAVLVSDYAYGTVTDRLIQLLEQLQSREPRVMVVDARELKRYSRLRPTAVKPNFAEAMQLLDGLPSAASAHRLRMLHLMGDRLLDETGASVCAVTLDVDGAIAFERGQPPYRAYARREPAAQSTGAGDTFAAALTLALAAHADTAMAIDLASAAAAAVVGTDGTTACTLEEVRRMDGDHSKLIDNRDVLADVVRLYRQQSRRIVFTNGCFDLLHRGHVALLHEARSMGDVLIVGLNADASVRQLKGPSRPVNTFADRADVLAALGCVDHVVPFHELTPLELIRAIRPDVFVKGNDYSRESLPEAELVERLGGSVQLLPILENRSTTGLIERIKRPAAHDGHLRLAHS